jgi:hypothetical protein
MSNKFNHLEFPDFQPGKMIQLIEIVVEGPPLHCQIIQSKSGMNSNTGGKSKVTRGSGKSMDRHLLL